VSMDRRRFLLSSAALAACSGAPVRRSGSFSGPGLAASGHRVPEKPPASDSTAAERVDIAIVGAGVAGLSAAWRLQRAGFTGSVRILELGLQEGGTSASRAGPAGDYPLGAHYLTLPNREAVHVLAMLQDFGILQSYDSAGLPTYDPVSLCWAPEERLFHGGRWHSGLWPSISALPEDGRQLGDFLAVCERWRNRKGSDGRWAFSIPVARSSRDPSIRALAGISFAQWLDSQGYTSHMLRWWLEYGCRDDYGTLLSGTSAWAGLHYHCARRAFVSDSRDIGTKVLTWPAGNGALVQALRARIPYGIELGALALEADPGDGSLYYEQSGQPMHLRSRHCILAVPSSVAGRLSGRKPGPVQPQASPWLVANLHCDRLPASVGVPHAWDNVLYGADSLGYVVNSHQTGSFGGPSTLTWFHAYCGSDLSAARTEAMASDWWSTEEQVLSELSQAHSDISSRVHRIDANIWGHGTVRPVPGLHSDDGLARLAEPIGRISFAHTDLSGLSLFEEASWHGVRAAEEALNALGHPLGESLL
jgi:hypothetical protein